VLSHGRNDGHARDDVGLRARRRCADHGADLVGSVPRPAKSSACEVIPDASGKLSMVMGVILRYANSDGDEHFRRCGSVVTNCG
jgi:hypothetical protein